MILELLERCQALGAELTPTEPDGLKVRAPAPLPDDLVAEIRQSKPLLVMAIVAFYRADRISAMLGCDPLTAAINRVSWLVLDCEDAAVPEAEIAPLRAEKRRLGELWETRQREAAA